MASYRVLIKQSAVKELERLPLKERRRVASRLRTLASNARPAGCEKLSGQEKFRLRQGDYRIIYSVDDAESTVTVVKIGHRRDVYR